MLFRSLTASSMARLIGSVATRTSIALVAAEVESFLSAGCTQAMRWRTCCARERRGRKDGRPQVPVRGPRCPAYAVTSTSGAGGFQAAFARRRSCGPRRPRRRLSQGGNDLGPPRPGDHTFALCAAEVKRAAQRAQTKLWRVPGPSTRPTRRRPRAAAG